MIITLPGNVPSLKNDKKIIYLRRNGKDTPSIVSSDRVQIWMGSAIIALRQAFRGCKIVGYPVSCTMTFYFDNDRRHDLDNAAAGVLDAMTAAEVIEDDNVKYINRLTLVYGGVDKKNPRVDIEFED
ncbi:MAG: RusA family crossover junction endodeoxyribonuclease [Candidatus Saccharimonadales bacterium]